MLPRLEMLKIALAHAENGAGFVYDERGIPAFQHEGKKCLIGIFIAMSTYHSSEMESMTLYEMRQEGLIDDDELSFFKEMDAICVLDDEEWLSEIQEKINDELESSD